MHHHLRSGLEEYDLSMAREDMAALEKDYEWDIGDFDWGEEEEHNE